MDKPSLLVITAHVGDFVWRCGGAIALHAAQGHRVGVVCMAIGERGESARLYQEEGMTAASARVVREAEAQEAAEILGAELHFLGGDDYPLETTPEMLPRTVEILRDFQPAAILTHAEHDPSNLDHAVAHRFALTARQTAQAHGRPGGEIIGAPQVFCFEPHQAELCRFVPDTLLDISEAWETKWRAMQAMKGQVSLWDYYRRVAEQRGAILKRRSRGPAAKAYAEAYMSIFPRAVTSLV